MLSPTIGRWIETPTGTLSLAAIPLAFALFKILQKPRRLSKVSKTEERVLVLGATSGIGRSIARQYAERGAVVCIVGRRGALVDEVVEECRQARSSLRLGTTDEKNDFLGVTADFANVDDMVRVREVIQSSVYSLPFYYSFTQFDLGLDWKGLDTIVVAAGVSALQPLMAVAGVETADGGFTLEEASRNSYDNRKLCWPSYCRSRLCKLPLRWLIRQLTTPRYLSCRKHQSHQRPPSFHRYPP